MCLSTVFVYEDGKKSEVMEQVAYVEAKNNGFLLIGLLGDKKFIQGKIKSLDFVDEHSVVIEGIDGQNLR